MTLARAQIDAALASVSVDWRAMLHCRGKATDVPELLRAALLGDGEARAGLFDALFYQGSVFEPTSHAGRVLLAVAPDLEAAARPFFAGFVTDLAHGYTMTEGQGLLRWVPEGHRDRAEVVAQYEREKTWVADAHRVASAAHPMLLRWLADCDAKLAVELPYALVTLVFLEREPSASTAVAGPLVDAIRALRARELSPKVDAGCAYALGALARFVPEATGDLERMLDAAWPIRVSAALSLARNDRSHAQALAVLRESLSLREEHERWLPDPFPWRSGHLRFAILAALSAAGVNDAESDRAVAIVVGIIERDASSATFGLDVLPALRRALGPNEGDVPLSANAHTLLTAVVESERMWPTAHRDGSMEQQLKQLGLPSTRGELRALLARQPLS